MRTLWAPWRQRYVNGQHEGRKGVPEQLRGWPGPDTGCVFCNMLAAVQWGLTAGLPVEETYRAAGILRMDEHCFVCLNAFPYSSGHVMIIPYAHVPTLMELPTITAAAMMEVAQQVERSLRKAYHPNGLNLGCNIGEAAGAGIANHLHLHALPRWSGDTNFMTALAETRVQPESLDVSWARLRPLLT